VLHKDVDKNVLYVGQEHDHPWLLSTTLGASQVSWVSGEAPSANCPLQAQVRYRQRPQDCEIEETASGGIEVRFREAQRAVTPGQSVVIYDGEVCLGGGIIDYSDAPPVQGTLAPEPHSRRNLLA